MQCCGHHKKPDKLYSFSLAHRRNVREALSEFVCKNMKNIEVKTNGDQIFFVTFQFSKNNATFWYSEWRVTKYYIDSFTAFTSTPPQVSKYRVFSDLCFPTFGMNTGGNSVSLCMQSKYGKIRTRKNSVFGHFSRSSSLSNFVIISFSTINRHKPYCHSYISSTMTLKL